MMHCARAITKVQRAKKGEVLNKNCKFNLLLLSLKLVTCFLISYSRVNAFVLREINGEKKGKVIEL